MHEWTAASNQLAAVRYPRFYHHGRLTDRIDCTCRLQQYPIILQMQKSNMLKSGSYIKVRAIFCSPHTSSPFDYKKGLREYVEREEDDFIEPNQTGKQFNEKYDNKR